jgi:heme-degrading monooxygenase HmoA
MVITVFRSRLKPNAQADYIPVAQRMSELARSMPGYVSHKGFVADDGERVTIIEFESEAAQQAWRQHPEHVEAIKRSRSDFYAEFRLQVCNVQREVSFPEKA